MNIIFKFVLILWLIAVFSSAVAAEERFIPELKIWLKTDNEGTSNSDYIFLRTRLFDSNHRLIVELSRLVGPIYISTINKQIFSCESNSIIGTNEALVFGLNGNLLFSFNHLGFLRGAGMTEDQRLYWLHYNIVTENKPTNIVIVLNSAGKVVFRNQFREAKQLKFKDGEHHYSLSIPPAELPG